MRRRFSLAALLLTIVLPVMSQSTRRDMIVSTDWLAGVEASMTCFVLRYLGFDASLYDGSFVEWSRDDNSPVV
jgi:3-mercaptopyruvate sulfurtransferase SseA